MVNQIWTCTRYTLEFQTIKTKNNFHENVVIQENRQSDIPWRIRTNICKQYPTDNQNVKLHKPKRYKNTS